MTREAQQTPEADRSAHQFCVRPPSDVSVDEMSALHVRAFCEGSGGAALFGWRVGGPGLPPGSWVELATSAPNTSLIDYVTTDRDLLRSMIFDERIHIQCRSLDIAGVALDYIEARIRY